MMITMILMLAAVVKCQPLNPADTDLGLHESDTPVQVELLQQSSQRRRLAAYSSNTDDGGAGEEEDGRWLLGAAAAAVGVTSLMTVFTLCICCPPNSKRLRRDDVSYIGQIDLEDIRVISNRAVTSPGRWSTDSGVVVNDLLQQKLDVDRSTVLNNQRVAPARHCFDAAAAAADSANDAGTSDVPVLMDNGRIVLQYRNVYAGVRTAENSASKVRDPDTLDRTGPGHVVSGHVVSAPDKLPSDLEYDMNDVVWKNMAARSSK